MTIQAVCIFLSGGASAICIIGGVVAIGNLLWFPKDAGRDMLKDLAYIREWIERKNADN